ncbi:hypothetical protein [Rubrivirga sp. IMCC43871]|uniref:hypothetical protein n=1 Tax=Rubrivirga sp. IMCC43871 TaxID=3391575 RepID=UPI00398FD40B
MRSLLLAAALLVAAPASAQLAIGGQIGTPTGLSLKAGSGAGAVILAIGWDLDDSVSAEGHYLLRSRRLQGSDTNLALFYGPGVFVHTGGRDAFGVSLGVGLEAPLTQEIEIYGLVSPRLQLVEETDFDLGAGLGLRLRL